MVLSFCFKNMPILAEWPEILKHKVFEKIFEVTELLNMDKVTRSKVLGNMTTERDLRNQMRYATETATAEGLARGMAQGMAQGKAEGRAEIIRMMGAKGMTATEISKIVEIDVAEIEALLAGC